MFYLESIYRNRHCSRDSAWPSIVTIVIKILYFHAANKHKLEVRRLYKERRKLIEMHGSRCAYCHQYFLDSELGVDHVFPRALSGKSIARNMQLLCYPCQKMKYQPSTKLIQMNACIIKPRILSNYQLPSLGPRPGNQPRAI